jgi:flagellar FliL protein
VSSTLASARTGGSAGADAGAGADAPKKKSKLKLIIIAVVVLALVGGGAYFFVLKPKSGPAVKPVPVKGAVLPVDSININLADGHYLKLSFTLQLTAAAGSEVLDPGQALAIAIDQFSGQSMTELAKPPVRRKAITTFTTAVEKAYDDKVMDIYPTTFVMQ